MNHIYRLVWNHRQQKFVVSHEKTHARGRSGRTVMGGVAGALLAGLLGTAIAAPGATTLPTGGQVTAGNATISAGANTLTVQQTSPRAAINWQTFSIGSDATVNFVQPNASAIALNRVVGNEQSVISGALNANGQVFILNANGVLFTKGAQVNVGGLVASTLNLSDADFMAGKTAFTGNGGKGSVINLGTLNAADGGYVALLGNQVKNEGVIAARLGSAILAAGERVSLNFNGDSLVGVTVDKGTLDSLVENKQAMRADGGLVVLTAKGLDTVLSGVVNNTGEIRARTVANKDGRILLLGDMDSGTVNAGGVLDASAPAGGNGGFIETSAAHVKIAEDLKVKTSASQGSAGNWLIDPVDFTIAASGGDITGTALGTLLASNNVTIQTATGTNSATNRYGTSGSNGDIFVNDAVSWSTNKLTLNAYRNININANLNGSGTASLALEYGQGALAAGNTSTYSLNYGAKISLPAGLNFSTKLGSDGTTTSYTVITTLGAQGSATSADLQGIKGGLSGKYVLGADIDASTTSTWNSGAGFEPIGSYATQFSGTLDGLGHTITGLTVNRPLADNVGLLGCMGNAVVQNVGLVGGSVTGHAGVGSLIGLNLGGTVSNSYATGNVSGSDAYAGGLVGLNSGGTVSNSYATGNVSGNVQVGGLLGSTEYGTVRNSYATGTVNGNTYVGGLFAYSYSGTVSNSYAIGHVTGGNYAGGLAGYVSNYTSVSKTYATGAVAGSSYVGGLVGYNNGGLISNSYWNTTTFAGPGIAAGSTSGATGLFSTAMQVQSNFAGFDFTNTWAIYQNHTNPLLRSFMTPLAVTVSNTSKTYDGQTYSGSNSFIYSISSPTVYGTLSYGGTAASGVNAGTYTTSASGLYSGQQGYLISYVDGTLTINKAHLTVAAGNQSRLYGQSNPTFTQTITGFVNGENTSVVSGTPGNGSSTATATSGVGTYTIAGNASGLSAANYDFTAANGTLTVNKAHLTVAADNQSRLYGQSNPTFIQTISGFVNGENTSVVSGTPGNGSSTATAASGVGSYTITGNALGLSAANYDFTAANGTLTVNKAHLTVTADNQSRLYGQSNPTFTQTLTGFVNGEDSSVVSGSATGSTTANAASGVGTYAITGNASGLSAANYDFTAANGTLTVNKAHLTVAADNQSRLYGQSNPTFTQTLTGFVNGENASVVSGTLGMGSTTATDTSSVGTYTIAGNASGLSAANYDFTATNGTLTITDRPVASTDNELVSRTVATTVISPELTRSEGSVAVRSVGIASTGGDLPSTSSGPGNGPRATLVSTASNQESTELVSLSEVRGMGNGQGATPGTPGEFRVPAGRNSLVMMLDGGVRLPSGVEQQLFVVRADNQ
ncbi:MAG TPA: MBG domain-containing protein [Rhodocyclaceae bacterium]|nr:MBG domain-containing protein [Rhodocyclaceae bacterium]